MPPHTVCRVADLLALPEWPAEQLRLVLERWQSDVEVRLEASANAVRHDLLVRLVLIIEGF